ncbi:hypothetical protein RHSIM_Rhsim04G0239900 [Rhododendron simsii]|uniref:Transcription initiation factor IIE subunit beta n=1 Tax=Rhododendron simsii TaxID=118357 RepID=A0A834LN66_RHOSS|nr:hypothetical protein RHSIM_Rhsim04G0239900 [Rhododendron simsii]
MASSHRSPYKFKQHKNKSSFTSTAAKAAVSSFSTEKSSNSTPPTNAKTSAPTVKFSENSGRLQRFNVKEKSPVGVLIKRVVDLLRETRQALTTNQILEACNVDMIENKNVFENLRNNPKVVYDGRCFRYKSKHGLDDKDQVLKFIRTFPNGIDVDEVKDAYPTVMEDIQAMKAAGEIWLLSDKKKETIAYPNDLRVTINVDDDLKQLFREIELPRDMLDIEEDLVKNRMKPATDTVKRRMALALIANSEPKKKVIDFSKKKLTNSHLPELFTLPSTSKSR